MSQGTSGSKDNSECATLRIGNLPQPSEVEEIDPDANAGACVAAANRQNENDEKKGSVNVVPSGRKHPTFVNSD